MGPAAGWYGWAMSNDDAEGDHRAMINLGTAASSDSRPSEPLAETERSTDGADDSPGLGRRLRLAALTPLGVLRLGAARRHVTTHGRLGAGAVADAASLQRVLFALRTMVLIFVAVQIPLVTVPSVPPMVGGVGALLAVVLTQVALSRTSQRDAKTAIGLLGLVGDSVAAYLFGQAFVYGADWAHFISYPLLAVEGALVVGTAGATISTLTSIAVYLAQELERAGLGYPVGPRATIVVVGVFVCFGSFSAAFANLNRRARGDLQALLDVSTLLSLQETPTRIVQALDARLRDLVGARIRSVAARRPDGSYEVLRWRTPETRIITTSAIRGLSHHLGHDIEREIGDGRALTITVEAERDEIVIASLGLPDWVRAITLVPIDADGHLSGILPVLWDSPHVPTTAEMSLLNGLAQQTGLAFQQTQLRRARELAATDSLTGLANHRAFRDALEARISESRRHGGSFAILFCDLDRFKTVNDRFGHAVGDLLLQRIATAIRAAARSEDLVARYGGDELALLLVGAGRAGALEYAQRLRTEILAIENRFEVDMTIGVAVFPEDADSPENLIARADAAMYAGKRMGGGRIVLASELPPEA